MISEIRAIDIHTHINHGSRYDSAPSSLIYDATLDYQQKTAKAASIEKMFCSTFASVITVKDVELENDYMFDLAQKTQNLYQWVVIDPSNEKTIEQAEVMLGNKKCVGIKLHPVYHKYKLEDFGDKIFSFADEHKAIVLIHPQGGSHYILPFADKYPNVTFIMAHMGSWENGESDKIAITQAKYGNVYVDTSGKASLRNKGLEFLVNAAGSERILFGTDTYAAGSQRGRIEYALISDFDKENILRNNAVKLFKL